MVLNVPFSPRRDSIDRSNTFFKVVRYASSFFVSGRGFLPRSSKEIVSILPPGRPASIRRSVTAGCVRDICSYARMDQVPLR
jgi:hypothetical protein